MARPTSRTTFTTTACVLATVAAGVGSQPPAGIAPTFVERAVGASDHLGMPKAPAEAEIAPPRVVPPWDRPTPLVPLDLATEARPHYYVARGKAIALEHDGLRVAVHLAPGRGDADAWQAAAAAGVPVLSVDANAGGDWRLLDLAHPVAIEETAQWLDALADDDTVSFAAPVFHNPEVEGGWLTVTRDILVRVRMDLADAADAVLAGAAPGLAVLDRDFGGMLGAFRLRSGATNGFDVLATANRLAQDPRFAWAEPDVLATMSLHEIPNDAGFDSCWGLHNTGQTGGNEDVDMDGPEAWDILEGYSSVRILVMDTGVQQNHPDINQVTGRDFTNGQANGSGDGGPIGVCDDHGTAVAGCVSAIIDNGIGVPGMAAGCRSVSARMALQQTSPCSSTFASYQSSWVVNALSWGSSQGIQVSNASFGVTESSAIEDAYLTTRANGMIHFASAGNSSTGTVGFPGRAAGVNAVSAVNDLGNLASFSNWGSDIDFAAPGDDIYTTDRTGAAGYAFGDYTWIDGTSFASPYAAGCAALIVSAFPNLTVPSIESLLKTGAEDYGAAGYDIFYGWGLINARGALDLPGPSNNFCANATTINVASPFWLYGPDTYWTGSASSLPSELQETCEAGGVGVSNTVWYAFTPQWDGRISVNTNGSDYDTVLSIWFGFCNSAWELDCDDDGGSGFQSQILDLQVFAGLNYFVKVSDYNTASGGGNLDFNFQYFTETPANDPCFSATEITTYVFEDDPYPTSSATTSSCENEEYCIDDPSSRTVWYRFTPDVDGTADISTAGSDYDTVLSVYPACGFYLFDNCFTFEAIACNDDYGFPPLTVDQARLPAVPMQAGEDYVIKIGANQLLPLGGILEFSFEFTPDDGCNADLDGNGVVDVTDLLAVLGAWGTPSGDVNGDGTTDVSDLLDVLGNWGSC